MTDPNADLIGKTIHYHSGESCEVVGTWEHGDGYVTVRFPTGYETIKPAAIVRRSLQLQEES